MKNILTTSIAAIAVLQPFSQTVLAYELHEWGTFTSISGSDGILLGGLDVEEEKLPRFVYALDGMQNIGPGYAMGGKGFLFKRPLQNVTIKMETPVLYFYSDKPFHAQVKVDFNGGAISQWYPQRSGGESVPKMNIKSPTPAPKPGDPPAKPLTPEQVFKIRGGIDFSTKRTGAIEWEVDVLGKDADHSLSFKPGETLSWVYPRNPKANLLKVAGSKGQPDHYEDYLFYRGVGNSPLPVKFTVDTDETITISNTSKEAIPFLFVHEITPKGIT